jgi:TgpA N-terminal domain/Transglutaminase-like superfamily/Domain of unknown function (DUF4129)
MTAPVDTRAGPPGSGPAGTPAAGNQAGDPPGITTREIPAVLALALVSVTVALAFARVLAGSSYLVPLIVAVLLAHGVALACRALGRGPVVEGLASAGAALVYAAVAVAGSVSPGRVVDVARAGWTVARADAVPIRATNGTILLAVFVVWGAAAIADQLAFRRAASIGAIGPGVIVVIWCTALGTHGDRWITVAAFGVAATIFLAVQHQLLLERHRTRIGRTHVIDAPRWIAIALIAGIVAVGLGVAGAGAVPDADKPLLHVNGLGDDTGNRSYRTSVPPLLDVGDKLRQGAPEDLFTVAAPRPDYWRITALDQYRSVGGGQWTLTAAGNDAVGEGLDESIPKDALPQDYRIGPLGERWMPAAYRPVHSSRSDTLVVRASSTLVTGAASVSNLHYKVISATPVTELTAAQHAATAGGVPSDLRPYTSLPADVPEIVRTTAAAVTAGIDNPADKAQALRDFFRNGSFTYDPNVQLGDDEAAVAQFLTDRRGFCVQFASTYALMARSVGLPTRVAVGFTPGTLDPATGRYVVTSHDAHAWPEVWLRGVGWTHLYDPTPPSSTLAGGSDLPGELPPASTTPGTNPNQQPTPTPAATTPDTTPSSSPAPTTPATTPGGGVNIQTNPPSSGGTPWLGLLAILVLLVVGAPVLIVLFLKARRRSRRRHATDPAVAITGAWREAIDALADHRVASSGSETPLELARRVPGVAGRATGPPLEEIADAYTTVRYGEHPLPAQRAEAAWDALDTLRGELSAADGLRARVRARLSPGTLRRQPEPAGWSGRARSSSTND